MTISSSHTYRIQSLLPAFQKALDDKNTQIQAMAIPAGDWKASHPEGNSKVEQFVVNFLNAARDDGVHSIVTPAPLGDRIVHGNNPCTDANHSLYMQIKRGLVKTL